MKLLYVDPLTGESLEEPKDGFLEIEIPDQEDEQQPDREWLPDYYMERELAIRAKREVLNEQHKRRMNALDQEKRTLDWRYRDRFEDVVKKEITGTKKKSVDYAYGRAQIRTSTPTIISDQDKVLKWAKKHCPDAVKTVTKTTLLKSALPKGVDIPHVERVPVQSFSVTYPRAT
jgi:hypothetical protein